MNMVELYVEDKTIVQELVDLMKKRGMNPQVSDEDDHVSVTIGSSSKDRLQLAVGMATKRFGRDKVSVR